MFGDSLAEQEEKKEDSRVIMLFESGNHVNINASFYDAPVDTVRPIDAYVVTECGGACTQSARCAVEAVYSIFQKKNPGKTGARQVVAFDLEGRSSNPITGNSGGLAFAVSTAKYFFSHDPGPVAATGNVKSSHGGGEIGGIKGIREKIGRAIQELPDGGFILYPLANEPEISDELRGEIARHGLQLHAVSSVQEMITLLFADSGGNATDDSPKRAFNSSILWLIVGVLLFAGGAVWSYDKWGTVESVPPPAAVPVKPVEQEPVIEDGVHTGENSDLQASGELQEDQTGSSLEVAGREEIPQIDIPAESSAPPKQTWNQGFD